MGDSVKTFEESKHLRMDTLRYMITESPVITEDGTEVAGWVHINVAYEVGSFDPYTEEDRQRDRERMEEAKKRKAKADEEEGEAAMKALEREIYPPKVEDRIQ